MKRILIVDDMLGLVEEERLLLEEADLDCDVDCASSSEQAVAMLKVKPYHLAIIDIMMPVVDGLELLHLLKRDFHIPVLIYSAYLDQIHPVKLYQSGADQILSKPAPLDVFLDTVRLLLNPKAELTLLSMRGFSLREARDQVLRQMILKALKRTGYDMARAASLLDVNEDCLRQLAKRLRIPILHTLSKHLV